MRRSLLLVVVLACGSPVDLGGEGGGGDATAGGSSGGTELAGGSGGGDAGGSAGSPAGGAQAGGGAPAGGAQAGGAQAGGGPGTSTAISIIVEPGDNAAALKTAITGAHSSVHMVMYLLSNTAIINALIAQKNAGHDVKVLLNQYIPGNTSPNQSVYTQLQNAGVAVKWAPSTFTLTHEKCVIVDGTSAWIMTMNVTQSSPSSNREYLALDTDAADVAEAEALFQADWAAMAYTPTGVLVTAPVNAAPRLQQVIDSASSTLDIEAEELSDVQVSNALLSARGRGVTVKVVLADNAPSAAQMSAVGQLKAAGVSFVTLHDPYIHAKSIVADGKLAYVGSENFTTASLKHNRELGVLFTKASEVAKVVSTTRADFAAGTAL